MGAGTDAGAGVVVRERRRAGATLAAPMRIDELPTPAAVVDLERLERNAARMREHASALGVRLRPHVKTHKCVEIARLQHGGRAGPVTVSTVAEAEAFAAAGFGDLLYAVPVSPAKLDRLAAVARRRGRLALLLDHPVTADEVSRYASSTGRRWPVWLEIDCGDHRSGADPEDPQTAALARRIAGDPDLELAGLLTHAGQSYRCRSRDEIAAVARRERDVMTSLAGRLRAEGVAVAGVSVGSTPTATAVDHLAGVTEIRPGNYALFDAFQAAIGSCTADDIALSVIAEVVSVAPGRGTAVVDAGSLVLSADPGPVHVDPRCGFGIPCGLDGTPCADLRLRSLSQEHGVLEGDVAALRPGDRLRILPNHACLAAACHAILHVARGDTVIDRWHPVHGW